MLTISDVDMSEDGALVTFAGRSLQEAALRCGVKSLGTHEYPIEIYKMWMAMQWTTWIAWITSNCDSLSRSWKTDIGCTTQYLFTKAKLKRYRPNLRSPGLNMLAYTFSRLTLPCFIRLGSHKMCILTRTRRCFCSITTYFKCQQFDHV